MANEPVDFKSLLSTPVESAERPKPRPAGTYTGVIEKFQFDKSKNKLTPFVRFSVAAVSPGDGIDQQALQEAGPLDKWKPHRDYYLTNDALYRLRELIESCGIPTKGRSFNATIPELKGKPVVLQVVLDNSTNETTGEVSIFNKIAEMRGA
jgi:hypothetical protein